MAQTIKLKRSSVSGNTPSTSDLELGEVAINTYDGKMFIKKNDGSDSIVEIGGTSGTVTEAFKTIAVSGQSSVVADSATDTLTLVAGSNMTITTNASGDTITFASSGGGGSQNLFSTFAVSGQNNVVADSTTDTLTFVAGSGITLTTDNSADSITIAATASAITVQDEGSALSTAATTLNFVGAGVTASGTGATKTITISGGGGSQNVFSNIGVSGQGTIQADSTTDTLTFEAGTGISLATDTTNDKLTITATGGAASVANAASSIKEFKYDITTSTTTLTGSDANSNTLAYEAGAIQVFLNGILLDPATDYTASNGTSVVLTDAAVSGDDVQIVAFNRKIVTANVGIDTFTGNGSTTAYTLSSDPVSENNTRVHIDGVYQEKAAYSVSGTTLTFSAPPPNGSSIEVEVGFTQAEIGSTLDFADNAILRIGTGNDLQILHDGSNSIIKDTGTGDLQIAASTLEVKNSGLSETMLKAIEDGAVELYFDNSKKLETVTGGVTVTGTVTATTFSGDLSGTINAATTGTTQSASDNSTKIATTAYVDTAVTNLVDSAPGTLNTLNELAAALGDDANFSTTVTNSLATKVGLTATTGAANIPAGTTAQRPGSPAAGQFRYNSTLNQFEGYTSSWGAIGGGGTNTFTTDVFTASGSAAFTLSQAVSSPNDCIVHINGIYQIPTDAYTVSGTTLTFTATPVSGRKIVVYSVKAGVSGNNLNVQTINGNGTDHTFTLNVNPINENNTIVHIDGVYQQKSSYTVSGTSLSFGSGNIPANGTVIEVATFTQTEINVPVNDTIDTVHIKDDAVTSAKLGGNLVTPGNLTVTGTLTGTLATAAQTNITSVGTLSALNVGNITSTGNLSLNQDGANIYIGADLDLRILHDGSNGTFRNDTGDLTIDVAGGINLDSDAGEISFKDNGTEIGKLFNSSSNFAFEAGIQDKDILFRGNDGGSAITALTLDMANAGEATFNAGASFGAVTVVDVGAPNSTDQTLGSFRSQPGREIGFVWDDSQSTLGVATLTSHALAFHTGGNSSERMRIDTSGNVGIGTSPSSELHVKGANETQIWIEAPAGSNSGIRLLENGTNKWTIGNDQSNDGLFFYDFAASQERMRIDSSGKVGIGTNNPSATLHVDPAPNVTTSFGSPLIKVGGDNSWGGNGSIYSIGLGYVDSSVPTKSPAEIGLLTTDNSGHTKGALVFATRNVDTDTAPSERMRIDSSGKVGIGTTNPARRKLEITDQTPGIVFHDTNVTNLQHEIVGGGNAGLELSADFNNVGTGYIRFDVGGGVKGQFKEDGDLMVGPYGYNSASGIRNIGSQGRLFSDFSANASGFEVLLFNNRTASGLCSVIQYRTNGTSEGDLRGNGSGLSIVNVSDYRKKTNIRDLTGSLNIIKQLQPRLYEYKKEFGKPEGDYVGFIAHEIQEHIPSMVDIEKDAVYTQEDIDAGATEVNVGDPKYQAVAYSNNEMITRLVQAMQEQQVMIETLQTKVAELEAK